MVSRRCRHHTEMETNKGCCNGNAKLWCSSAWYPTHRKKKGIPAHRRRFGVAFAVLPQPMRWNASEDSGMRQRVANPALKATFAMKPVTSSGVVSHFPKCIFHANSITLEATPEDTAIIARGRISSLFLQYLHTCAPLARYDCVRQRIHSCALQPAWARERTHWSLCSTRKLSGFIQHNGTA